MILANLVNSVDFGQGFWQSMGNSYRRRVREMFTTDYDDILAHEAALEARANGRN